MKSTIFFFFWGGGGVTDLHLMGFLAIHHNVLMMGKRRRETQADVKFTISKRFKKNFIYCSSARDQH